MPHSQLRPCLPEFQPSPPQHPGDVKCRSITRKEYEEKGGGYLKEHCASNVYVPIRLPKQASRSTEAQASGKGSGASGGGAGEQA